MSSKTHALSGLRGTKAQAKTRILLALWDLGGTEIKIKKSDLTDRVKRKGENVGNYHSAFDQLEKEGAIAIVKNKASLSTPKGLEMLANGLKSSEFRFESSIGPKTANALLKWIQQMQVKQSLATTNGSVIANSSAPTTLTQPSKSKINSYKAFERVVLETYDRLNQDYNLDDLVPIYRIRREVGDRVTRSRFNEWLLEMQADDILQLQGGSIEDSALDKIEDSIKTEVSGLRCYAKCLTS